MPLTIVVARGGKGTSRIYEDAGDGYAYRKGESRTIVVEQSDAGVDLRIPANRGFQRIAALEVVGFDAAPREVRIDGKVTTATRFDADTRRLYISLPSETVRRVVFAP